MQFGETVNPTILVDTSGPHNKETCPWSHEEEKEKNDATEMEEPNPDEDEPGYIIAPPLPKKDEKAKQMSKNTGGTLGSRLGDCQGKNVIMVKFPDETEEAELPHQWAPHHLIPGNESLKGSNVVPYLGDDTVIKNYATIKNKPKLISRIIKGGTIGYDVNDAKNGEWLPSPYAISMVGDWPEEFNRQMAYVTAALDQCRYEKDGQSVTPQFHMRHNIYSDAVQDNLKAVGGRLAALTSLCEEAKSKDNKQKDKLEPPVHLKDRLFQIAENLRKLATGSLWVSPFLTDNNLITPYVKDKKFKTVSEQAIKNTIPQVKM